MTPAKDYGLQYTMNSINYGALGPAFSNYQPTDEIGMKLSESLAKLADEDPTFRWKEDEATRNNFV